MGRGIHGSTAGSLLGGAAFAQRAVDDAAQILGDDGGEDFLAVSFVQCVAPVDAGGCLGLLQRQQLTGCGILRENGDEIGVGNVDFVEIALQKRASKLLGNGEAVADGDIGCFRVGFRQDGDALALEIVHCLLADGQH